MLLNFQQLSSRHRRLASLEDGSRSIDRQAGWLAVVRLFGVASAQHDIDSKMVRCFGCWRGTRDGQGRPRARRCQIFPPTSWTLVVAVLDEPPPRRVALITRRGSPVEFQRSAAPSPHTARRRRAGAKFRWSQIEDECRVGPAPASS